MAPSDRIHSQLREKLRSLGLPDGDDYALPDSVHRFKDGGHFQIEAATVNTLGAAEVLLQRLGDEGVRLDQLTNTFGLMRITDRALADWVELGRAYNLHLIMSVGPRGSFDTGAQKMADSMAAHAGNYRLRGMEQILRALSDVERGLAAGVTRFLVFDEGLLYVLGRLRSDGDLPSSVRFKASAALGVQNPVHCKLLADMGADSVNLQRDLELPMISSVRQAVGNLPLDIHSDNPRASGGFIRSYEVPEIVRIAAPVLVKCGNSAVPEHDVAMNREQAAAMADQIVCVAELIARLGPGLTQSADRDAAPVIAGA